MDTMSCILRRSSKTRPTIGKPDSNAQRVRPEAFGASSKAHTEEALVARTSGGCALNIVLELQVLLRGTVGFIGTSILPIAKEESNSNW